MLSYSDKYVALALVSSFLFGWHLALENTAGGVIRARMQGYSNIEPVVAAEQPRSNPVIEAQVSTVAPKVPATEIEQIEEVAKKDSTSRRLEATEATTEETSTKAEPSSWMEYFSTSLLLGAAIGSLAGGWLCSVGHRAALFVSHVLNVIGAVIAVSTHSPIAIIVARGIWGVSLGIAGVAGPRFINEMCTVEKRGPRGVFHQVLLTVGLLAVMCVGALTTPAVTGEDGSVIVMSASDMTTTDKIILLSMYALPGIASAVCIVLMVRVLRDDTPASLMEHGRAKPATLVLNKIHGDKIVEADERFAELVANLEQSRRQTGSVIAKLIRNKPNLTAFLVCIALSIGQQLSGINVIMTSSSQLLTESLGENNAKYMTLGIGLLNCLMNIPAVLFINKFGRKPFLLLGNVGQAACLAVYPIVVWAGLKYTQGAVIVSVLGFTASFAMAMGPVFWVFLFEALPQDIRSLGSSTALFLNWIIGAIVVQTVKWLSWKAHRVLATFSILSVCVAVFVLIFVRETKGRSISPYLQGSQVPKGMVSTEEEAENEALLVK